VCGKTDSAAATNIKPQPVYGITFTEWATIDAVVISLQKPLGIYVDKYAVVHGLLWTKGYASIDGTVYGIVIADNFVNSTLVKNKAKDLEQAKNYFNGAIKKLPNFNSYRFPVFMGTMSICSWQEH
jgi:hypothetical protein